MCGLCLNFVHYNSSWHFRQIHYLPSYWIIPKSIHTFTKCLQKAQRNLGQTCLWVAGIPCWGYKHIFHQVSLTARGILYSTVSLKFGGSLNTILLEKKLHFECETPINIFFKNRETVISPSPKVIYTAILKLIKLLPETQR